MEDSNELEPKHMINELVRVRILDDPNPGNYYSRIDDAIKKMLIITWPTENGIPLPIRPDQMLGFSMVREGIAYFFNGLVDTFTREPLPSVTIIISSDITRIQRRQDYRIKCLIPIEAIATLSETSGGLHPVEMRLKTNTYDLSASGVSLRASTAIPDGTLLVIKLSMPDGENSIKSSCRVAHCFLATDNTNMFHVGIQFMNIEERDKSRLARFINRTQLKRIQM